MLGVGPKKPKERWPEQHPAQERPEDRGLADALHGLAQQAADEDEDRDLREKQEFGLFGFAAAGRCECSGRQDGNERRLAPGV